MRICSACGHALTSDGPCGFASITVGEKTTYLCHADDHSCYMEWQAVAEDPREYSVQVTAFEIDDAAAEALFDRVADAAHALDEQVTVTGGRVDSGEASPMRMLLWEPLSGPVSSRPSPGADPRLKALVSYWDGIYGDTDADWSAVDVLAAADAADPLRAAVRAFLDHWDAFVGDDDIVVLRVNAVAELRAALRGEQ